MMADWPTLALYWYGARRGRRGAPSIRSSAGRSPSTCSRCRRWQLIAGWLMTLAVIVCAIAVFFVGRRRRHARCSAAARDDRRVAAGAALSIAVAALLLTLAAQVYLGRFERLFDDHTIFAGVTYTDAHVTLTGMLIVAIALVARRG